MQINGLSEMKAMLSRAPEVAIKHVNSAIVGALTAVEISAKKQAPIGLTKKLHNNWSKITRPLEGRLTSQMPYASAVQFGTPPHKVPYDEIAPWAISKGISPYAVMHSIAKKGTKANPFFTRAMQESEERVNTIFKGTLDGIIKELTK